MTANNATNNATRNYYVYLDITSNDFEYTTEDRQAEILLKVTDPDGTEITSINGLTRKTSGRGENEVTGFDITTTEDLIRIVDNYEITSTGTVTQEWNIEIIFVNLNSDQNGNTNKTFNANVIIQETAMEGGVSIPTLANVCPDGGNLASCIQTYYTAYGEGTYGLYLHDGIGTYTNADQEAEDNSYRYAGANPNNYVCFGSDEETCPADNLYRIIGVFGDEVKLIKSDYATSALLGTNGDYSGDTYKDNTDYYKGNLDVFDAYYWNGNNQNTWSESLLNKINLNTNYLNNIGNDWNNKIANHTWQIGGNTYDNILKNTVKNTYQNEIINPLTNTTYSAKIGLMYVSDYGYAASPESWNTTLLYYDEVKSVN